MAESSSTTRIRCICRVLLSIFCSYVGSCLQQSVEDEHHKPLTASFCSLTSGSRCRVAPGTFGLEKGKKDVQPSIRGHFHMWSGRPGRSLEQCPMRIESSFRFSFSLLELLRSHCWRGISCGY